MILCMKCLLKCIKNKQKYCWKFLFLYKDHSENFTGGGRRGWRLYDFRRRNMTPSEDWQKHLPILGTFLRTLAKSRYPPSKNLHPSTPPSKNLHSLNSISIIKQYISVLQIIWLVIMIKNAENYICSQHVINSSYNL